jgi:hypothetical protein
MAPPIAEKLLLIYKKRFSESGLYRDASSEMDSDGKVQIFPDNMR